MSERETRSLKVNPKLWRLVKIHCAEKEIDISDYIEELIEKDLKK